MARQFTVSLLLSLILCLPLYISCANHLCQPDDALSLLQFKEEMLEVNASSSGSASCDDVGQYSYPKMISWNKSTSSDCCTWDGVTCHEITGHVIELDLSCSRLMGVVHQNSSLFRLSQLKKLNLAYNDLNQSKIFPSLGGLSSLTHLNLSCSEFRGTIPSQLSQLSKLILLDLSSFWNCRNCLRFSPCGFQTLLQNLTHIKVLSLSEVEISDTLPANYSSSLTYLDLTDTRVHGKLSNSIFHLPKLQKLILRRNQNLIVRLPKRNCSNIVPRLRTLDLSSTNCSSDGTLDFIGSFASIEYLDLSDCKLTGSFPNSIGNLSHIVHLDLGFNYLTGNIPVEISNLPKLSELSLSNNFFSSQFPSHIGNLSELSMLSLDGNSLSGSLPSNMSGLQKLSLLSLARNEFHDTIPSWLFSIPLLRLLDLNNNHFTGKIKEFKGRSLVGIFFSNNQLDGPIPDSISQLVNLSAIDLSSNNLNGSINFSLFAHLNSLQLLDLSDNKLSVKIDNRINISFPSLYSLGLSSCEITEFPYFLRNSNLHYLKLSNNKLQGQIPNWILRYSLGYFNLSYNYLSGLGSFNTVPLILDLKSNEFSGPLPFSLCRSKELFFLDLSNNRFTGSIPECFGNLSNELSVLNLAKNHLTGTISVTFPRDNQLSDLNLNGNLLEGPLPRSLANCTELNVLDVGNNKINDTFPTFLEDLKELQVLILKSNRFSGSIPNFKNKKFLPELRVLDISLNGFTGVLPLELFGSFKAMTTSEVGPKASYFGSFSSGFGSLDGQYYHSMSFVIKGQVLDYERILTNLVAIDLSSNNFTGDIPEIIGNLSSLIVLNLSRNKFSGHIPAALGELYLLESLDLSWNQIEGEIPLQLADLTKLGFLNLSHNHLVGQIPQGKQFNTFLNDSYYGNLGLCGFPVTKSCGGTDQQSPSYQGSYEDDEDSSFWIGFTWESVVIGYGFGFAIGCLVYFTGKPKWLVRNIEEVCWYGLLLLGRKEMCKQLKKSWRSG